MGNRIAKFEGEKQWVVWQSNSMSAYSPIFDDELSALVFARLYSSSSRGDLFAKDFSDQVQMQLSTQIAAFLNEVCQTDRFGCREIPKQWAREMDPEPDSIYGYEDLVLDFEANYECAQADVVITAFNVWRTATGQKFLPMKEAIA